MKNAWVCYCLLKDKGEGERLNAALQEIQGLMEQKEYDRLWQGFATGVEIAGSYPFREYERGFRAKLSQEQEVYVTLENLVLSYAMFQQKPDLFEQEGETEAYLILLVSGMEYQKEEVASLLRRFRRLPTGDRVKICWIPEREQDRWGEELEPGLVDVIGRETLEYQLMG